jgi:hypothetical protein
MVREIAFGVVLLIAAACLVIGVAHFSVGAAWMVAGVLLAGIGWLVLGDDTEATGAIVDDEVNL